MEKYKLLMDVAEEKNVALFEDYSKGLSQLILNSDARFSIGIFGGWGTGKTTLMNCIESKLESDDIITVQFNAWRYEKEENLLIPLLHTLKDSLSKSGIEDVAKVAKTIGGVIHSLVAATTIKFGIPKAFDVTIDGGKALANAENLEKRDKAEEDSIGGSIYHTCYKVLHQAINDFRSGNKNRKIVIFMDDLDRCAPESILDVLESMKLFFDTEGVVFVVGLDQKVVEEAIKHKYSSFEQNGDDEKNSIRIDGAEYLKKMFQVPFHLLPTTKESLDDILNHIYESSKLEPEQKSEIKKVVRPHLDYLFDNGGVNPREIKRYINSYTITRLTNSDLDPDVILAVQTIIFRKDWYLVKLCLEKYREIFLKRLRSFISEGELNKNRFRMPDIEDFPMSFIEYVSKESPGNKLINKDKIDCYLALGKIKNNFIDNNINSFIEIVFKVFDKLNLKDGLFECTESINEALVFLDERDLKDCRSLNLANTIIQELSEYLNDIDDETLEKEETKNKALKMISESINAVLS